MQLATMAIGSANPDTKGKHLFLIEIIQFNIAALVAFANGKYKIMLVIRHLTESSIHVNLY